MSRIVSLVPDPRSQEHDESLRSRSDARRANRVVEETLARLAADLAELSTKRLEALELPEELFDALQTLQAIKSAAARNRQLRLVRSALRDLDHGALRADLDALLEHGVVPRRAAADSDSEEEGTSEAASADAVEAGWVARLLGEGNHGLNAFVEQFPRADRNHLRQLVKSVQGASHERRNKAERRLLQAVRGFLR